MKDFFDSLMEAYRGRFRNKFTGTFVLFLIGLNWKKFVSVFFISEMTYEGFLAVWSMSVMEFLCGLGVALILTALYLFIVPWVSYYVHYIQSKPILEYKYQTIKNNELLLARKEAEQELRNKVLILEEKNIAIESKNEKTESEKVLLNHDRAIFLKLKAILPEKKLMEVFDDIKESNFKRENRNILKDFFNESCLIENTFNDEKLNMTIGVVSKNIESLFLIVDDLLKEANKNSLASLDRVKHLRLDVLNKRDDVINSYRDFLRCGVNFDN